jgi:GMP synthase-like glutamine amidotransferase
MRIGLILCDHLDDDVAAVVGDYPALFDALFAPLGVAFTIYEATRGELPDDLDAHDGWLISGSRASSTDDEPWIRDVTDVTARLIEAQQPTVGICFGHQVAARALGGTVERATTGWGLGVRHFDVVDDTFAAAGPTPPQISLLMSHQDQVTKLPSDARLLATADYCPVGAFTVGDHFLGVQGHPEWTPDLARMLGARRRDRIGEAIVDAAMQTVDGPTDHLTVAGWAVELFAPT